MKTVDVLKKARELVAKGWCKGSFKSGNRYCALGALEVAVGYDWTKEEDQPEILKRAEKKLASVIRYLNIVSFNDATGTRKKDVLAAFDRAIKKAEQKK